MNIECAMFMTVQAIYHVKNVLQYAINDQRKVLTAFFEYKDPAALSVRKTLASVIKR